MEYKNFNGKYLIVLHKGEELVSCIQKVCDECNITFGKISGIGAADITEVGIFDTAAQKYNIKKIDSFCEITSVNGNITSKDNQPYLHLHITLADKNTNILGGHLLTCIIGVTAEIFIDIIDDSVTRLLDEKSGINFIHL